MTGGRALFPRIVVPVDGSHFSGTAADAAATLARRLGVPMTLFGITHSDGDRDRIVKGLDDLVASLRRDLIVDVVVDAVGAVMTVGSYVADSILDEAGRDGALVCIASHGHSGLGAALVGSTTEAVLRRSQRPVLVVGPKHDGRPWGEDALLVASVDGSPLSEQAIPIAAEWSAALASTDVAGPGRRPGRRPAAECRQPRRLQRDRVPEEPLGALPARPLRRTAQRPSRTRARRPDFAMARSRCS